MTAMQWIQQDWDRWAKLCCSSGQRFSHREAVEVFADLSARSCTNENFEVLFLLLQTNYWEDLEQPFSSPT